MPRKKGKKSAKVRIFIDTIRAESTGELYGVPVCEFKSSGKVDARLNRIEHDRFEAWLNLRAALQGKTATGKDRAAALEKMTAILRGALPASIALMQQEPVGEPVGIIKNGVVGAEPGQWGVWVTSFRRGDGSLEARRGEELSQADTPEHAYDYWSRVMLRQTMLAERKGAPAILCIGTNGNKNGLQVSALEVAHYVSALLNHRPAWCLRCATMFVPSRSDAEYCGDTCRWADQKAKQRKKQKRRHARAA